jgi:hypothetical protein
METTVRDRVAMGQAATAPANDGARPLYTVADIRRLFRCSRSKVYSIPGLADCRVPHAPGVRFDPNAVDALLRAPAPARRRSRATA